jgi:hypothetical protein
MAISPKSKGLGNIGSIVNRQRMASPTKPAPKPVAKMPVPKPVTTTLAQRQASQPFKNYSKPAQPKINPLAQQQPNPLQQAMSPQPRTDIPPGAMMRKPMLGAQPMTPPPQTFNPQPNPGQMPMNPSMNPYGPQPDPYVRDMQYKPGRDYEVGGPNDPLVQARMPQGPVPDPFMGGLYGGPDVMPPDYDPYQGMIGGGGQQPANYNNGYQVGGDPWYDPNGQLSGMQPDSMASDYDQLEGSAFNSGGSLFGGGGFAGK